jgi:hypothetical protein
MIIWTWKLGGIECDDPEKLRSLEKKNKSEKPSEGIGEMHILLKQSANQSVFSASLQVSNSYLGNFPGMALFVYHFRAYKFLDKRKRT